MIKLTKKELERIREYNLGSCHDSYELAYEPKRLVREAVLRGYISPIAYHATTFWDGVSIIAYNEDYIIGYHTRQRTGEPEIKEDFFKVKLNYRCSSIDGDDSEANNYYYFTARGVKYRLDEFMRSSF